MFSVRLGKREREKSGINCGRIHTSIIVDRGTCYLEVRNRHPVLLNGRNVEAIGEGAFTFIDLNADDT